VSRLDYLFTSESVAEGHPDKVCDRISDTVLDLFLAADPQARVACETLATTNEVVIAGEVRGPASVTFEKIEQGARELSWYIHVKIEPQFRNPPGYVPIELNVKALQGAFSPFPASIQLTRIYKSLYTI